MTKLFHLRIYLSIAKHLFIFFLFCFFSSTAHAGGTAVNGVATRAQTMQNAFTAVADDASAVFYNPAGLTQIEGSEIQTNFILLAPNIRYTNSTNATSTDSTKLEFGGSLFASTDVVKPVTLAFGVYAPFARKTDYDQNAAVFNLPHDSSLLRLDFVPSVAVDLGKYVSVGAGFVASYVTLKTDILGFSESGNGYGFSGQGGILVKPIERLSLGVNFRGPMKANVNGSGDLTAVGTDDFDADVKFPGILSFGAASQVLDKLLLSFNLDWEFWSYVNEIRRDYTNPAHQALGVTTLDAENSVSIRFGGAYQPWEKGEFRAGYAFVESAVPVNNIIPAIPEFSTHAFSIGYGHKIKNWQLNAGYELAHMLDRNSASAIFPGTYKMDVHSFLAGVTYQFGVAR